MPENAVYATGAGIADSYPYSPGGQQVHPREAAPAPLNAQMAALLEMLTGLTELVEHLDGPLMPKMVCTDTLTEDEGLTALIAVCQGEASKLERALQSIAGRIGRL